MPSIVSPSVEENAQAKSSTLSRPSTTDPETDSGKRRKAVSTFETNLSRPWNRLWLLDSLKLLIGGLCTGVLGVARLQKVRPSLLDANKFLLVSLFILVETIWPKVWAKSLTKNVRGPLPVDMRLSKTSLLELPNVLLTVLRYFAGMIIELFIYTKFVPTFIAVAKFVSCLPCIVPRRVG